MKKPVSYNFCIHMYIFSVTLFGIQIAPTWYGLMYAIGFSFCYFFIGKYGKIQKEHIDTLLFYIFLWVIGWGRIGYILFYNPDYFLENPSEIIAIWNGGMSFHGGFLWVLVATYIYGKKYKYNFFEITDILAICIPVALGLGRMGNWINEELPWYAGYTGIFAMTIGDVSYFPSPLLQAFLEGIILFGIMFYFWNKSQKFLILWTHDTINPWYYAPGKLSAVFLIWYASMRLIAEKFRLPDGHVGYLFDTSWITLGMLYTLPMFLAGIAILILSKKKEANE